MAGNPISRARRAMGIVVPMAGVTQGELDGLRQARGEAVTALLRIVKDEGKPDVIRIAAAKCILDTARSAEQLSAPKSVDDWSSSREAEAARRALTPDAWVPPLLDPPPENPTQ